MPTPRLKIFYDGACHLCSREMDHYKKLREKDKFDFIDITSSDFRADEFGLDRKFLDIEMHVMDENGQIHTGVRSFIEIWKRIPSWQWVARLASLPGVYHLMCVGYFVFARFVRPYLPKRKQACEI